jgi:hypothetical protein
VILENGECGVSPDLTPLDGFLWAALKNGVYTSEPCKLQDLRCEIEIVCAAVPLVPIQNVCQSVHVAVNNALLLMVDILNICDFKCENIAVLFIYVNCEHSKFVHVFFFWDTHVCVYNTICCSSVVAYCSCMHAVMRLNVVKSTQ